MMSVFMVSSGGATLIRNYLSYGHLPTRLDQEGQNTALDSQRLRASQPADVRALGLARDIHRRATCLGGLRV